MNKPVVKDYLIENYRDYYKKDIEEWRRMSAVGKVDNILALCREQPYSSVLEIGAGDGAILARLSELGFAKSFYGLDLSSSGVERIKEKKIPHLIECKTFDGYKIPYDDNQFDLVILSHVLEHVEHPRLLLYEIARVAKCIFIEVPLEHTLRMPNDFVFNPVGHINFYSPKIVRRLLQSCNLEVLSQIIVNPRKETYRYEKGFRGLIDYHIKQIFLRFFPAIAPSLFTYHDALLCQKK